MSRENRVFRKIKRAVGVAAAVSAVLLAIILYNYLKPTYGDGEALAVYFNIGQGDAAAFITQDICITIDAGTNESEERLIAYLESFGVKQIDCAVFSHPHDDHIGGADGILNAFEVSSVLMPDSVSELRVYDEMMREIDANGCYKYRATPGLELSFDDVKLTVLAPCADFGDLNLDCAVIMISYGETSFLYMGDCEGEAIDAALDMMGDAAFGCDVIKIGHHGAAKATTERLLSAAAPDIAVISCGAGNDYSHPHREVLSMLSSHNIDIYRTDIDGTIKIKTDGVRVTRMDK